MGRQQVLELRPTSFEMEFLQETLSADYITSKIRLREGEYQYDLAKIIVSFQLKLYFPDVKDIIRKLYGEEKANDIQFIRKIQTILKKMERNNIVKIFPKKKPWELQRYALSSFKFQDVDKNLVIFATDQQIKQAQNLLHSVLIQREMTTARPSNVKIEICGLIFIVVALYTATVWALVQPIINLIVFVFALSSAIMCSVMLGKILAKK